MMLSFMVIAIEDKSQFTDGLGRVTMMESHADRLHNYLRFPVTDKMPALKLGDVITFTVCGPVCSLEEGQKYVPPIDRHLAPF